MLEDTGFSVSNIRFRDAYLRELESRGQTNSPVCMKLKVWKDASAGLNKMKVGTEIGKKMVFRARLHVQWS